MNELCKTVGERVIRFNVVGRPQQRGSKHAFVHPLSGKVVTKDMNDKSASWMQQVRETAANAMDGQHLLTGPIRLSVTFRFARPKSHYGTGRNAGKLKPSAPDRHAQSPDLAKLIRCLEDALTGVVWRDDRQVFAYLNCFRVWTQQSEGVHVKIAEIDGAQMRE